MKKRHHHKMNEKKHHDMKHQMMEHMDGSMMGRERMGEEYYAGHGNRRKQEMRDAGMIYEDHNAMANLPQHPIMKHYETGYRYMPEGLDDTIRGIDNQIGADDNMARKQLHPHKY